MIMILEEGTLRRYLSHEAGTLIIEMRALKKTFHRNH